MTILSKIKKHGTIIIGGDTCSCSVIVERVSSKIDEIKKSQDRIVFRRSENSFDYIVDMLATLEAGKIFFPVKELEKLPFNGVGAGLNLPKDKGSGIIFYTSGSTGKSKLIYQSEESIIINTELSLSHQNFDSRSHSYSPIAINHSGGLMMQFLPVLFAGGTVDITSGSKLSDLKKGLSKANTALLVPSTLRYLFSSEFWKGGSFPQLKYVLTGSSPVTPDIYDELEQKGISVLSVYGLTEVGPFVSVENNNRTLPEKTISSLGQPLKDYEVRIEADQIMLKGPCVGEKVTYKGGVFNFEKVEWMETGDSGFLLDGTLFLTGRTSDVVIVRAEKFYLSEVEEVINSLPEVLESKVYKKLNQYGEDVLFVDVVTELSSFALKKKLLKILPVVKIPRVIKKVVSIDKTLIGKNIKLNS